MSDFSLHKTRSSTPKRLPKIGFGFALVARTLLGAQADPSELPNLSLEELLNVRVAVASRTDTKLLEAPSVVSVITAEDIHRMGARDLRDVLRTVPGFELGQRMFGYPEIGLRGIITDNTEKIRILVDGQPINENLEGSGAILFGEMALENVERIEIIRGPGSALYGTNAFVGVISILTKSAPASGTSTTLTLKGGSFRTGEGSVLTGWSDSDVRLSAYFHYLSTDGPRSPIQHDALSDSQPDVSLAGSPAGHTNEFRRNLTAQFKLEWDDFYFNGLFTDTRKGPYIGALYAINEHSEAHPSQLQGVAGYTFRPTESMVIESRIYSLHYIADNLWNSAPPGFRATDEQGNVLATYSQGFYNRNGGTQDTTGSEVKITWTPAETHKVVTGVSYEEATLYRSINEVNLPGTGPDHLVDAGPIQLKNPGRYVSALYVQDQWDPINTLGITAGLRLDRYNDAGTARNPRLALVWKPHSDFSLKLLYGEAFRAPTFVELYLYANGGLFTGREGNKPEAIRTWEAEGSYRLGNWGLWSLTLFRNRITDLLRLVPLASGALQYQNSDDVTIVKGFESELKLTFSDSLVGFANYSGQSGHSERTGEKLVGMANWRANTGLTWTLLEKMNISAYLNMVGKRQRAPLDLRPELPGYQVVDLTSNFMLRPNLELSLIAHNLFNADQRFPDITGKVPQDFPWEGCAIQGVLKWRF